MDIQTNDESQDINGQVQEVEAATSELVIPESKVIPEPPKLTPEQEDRAAELSGGMESVGSGPSVVSMQKQQTQDYLELEAKRNSAGFFESDRDDGDLPSWQDHTGISSLVQSFKEFSIFGEVTDWAMYRASLGEKTDYDFVNKLNKDVLLETITKYGLELDAVDRLSKAQNEVHYQRILSGELQIKARLDLINETSGDTTQSIMAGGFMFADPTLFIGVTKIPAALRVMQFANKTGRVTAKAGTMAAAVGTQVLMAEMRSVVDKRYTSEDYILDIFIGGGIDFISAGRNIAKIGKEGFVPAGLLPYKKTSEASMVSYSGFDSPFNMVQPLDMSKSYRWSDDRFPGYTVLDDTQIEINNIAKTQEADLLAKAEASSMDTDTFIRLSKNIVEETNSIGVSIDNLVDVGSNAGKKLVGELREVIKQITQVSQSAGDKLLAKLEKKTGEAIVPQTFSAEDIANAKNKKKRNKKKSEDKKKHQSNYQELKNMISRRVESLRKVVETAQKKLKPRPKDKSLSPDKQKELDGSELSLTNKREEVRLQQEKIDGMKEGGGKASAKKKLDRLKREVDELQSSFDELATGKVSKEQADVKTNQDSLERQKDMYELIGGEIDEMIQDLNEALQSITMNTLRTQKAKDDFVKNLSDMLEETLGYRVGIKLSDEGELLLDAPVVLKADENGNVFIQGKKIPLIIAMTVGSGAIATADDGSAVFTFAAAPALFMLAVVVSPKIIRKIKNQGVAGAVADSYDKVKASVKKGDRMTSPEGKETTSFIDKTAEAMRTSFLESIVEVLKNGSDWSVDMARKLAYDSVNGNGATPAEVAKRHAIKTMTTRYRLNAEIESFNNWKLGEDATTLETGLSKLEAAYAESAMLREFRHLVSDAMENPLKNKDPDVRKAADALKKEFDKMVKDANEAGVPGFSDKQLKTFENDYFPHVWNSGEIRNLALMSDDIEPLIEGFTRMIKGGKRAKPLTDKAARDMAVTLLDVIKKPTAVGAQSVKDINSVLKTLDELGFDITDISADDISKGLTDVSEIVSRAKNRIQMDTSLFGDVKMTIEKKTVDVKLSHVMERDSIVALENYANQVQGAIEVKRSTGFGSKAALDRAIRESEPDAEVRKVLEYYSNVMYGKPIYDIGSKLNQNLNTVKNLSFFGVLGWVVFSIAPEMLKATVTLMKSGAARRQMFDMMKSIGKETSGSSALYEELQTLVGGWGTSLVRQDYRFRGQDDITSVSDELAARSGMAGGANRLSNELKSATVFLSGLAKTSDMLQKIQSVGMAERLGKLVNGTETMSDARKARYGIDDNFIKAMKERLIMKDGELQSLDFDNWNLQDQRSFRQVMERMVMNQAQEVTMGGTPMFMYNSSVGRLLMHIMSFTSQMYSNHFIAGLKTRDLEEVMTQILWFAGGYIGLSARYAVQGKDVDEDVIMQRTLMSMPFAASFGALNGIIDPVALAFAENVKTTSGDIAMDVMGQD